MGKLQNIIKKFQETDEEFRLDLLLDYSEKLPRLPEKIQTKLRQEKHRVPECQTPVYLEISAENQQLLIQAEVPPESPTIRGIISILSLALNGCSLKNLEEIPTDLLTRLGLNKKIGTLRSQGINAIIQRMRCEIKQLVDVE
jgi:cysteine desulfuration protein SufE